MVKRLLVVCLAVFMAVGMASAASAAYIWVDASYDVPDLWDGAPDETIILEPCGVVWLNVHVGGLDSISGDYPAYNGGLWSFGFNAYFDPDQLELTPGTDYYDVLNGGPWAPSSGTVDMHEDYVYMSAMNMGGVFGSEALLGVIELHCKAPGVSHLDFTAPVGIPGFTEAFTGVSLDEFIVHPSIEIINTPIPSAVLLLGSGLLGLVGFRRRRMK